ncbi:MAG: SH3 domain-containing protein [Candidatus Omnitrophica bacterium]|nr:SH3 domain-containing protein [Candidatus Omnitrophota bacterium]
MIHSAKVPLACFLSLFLFLNCFAQSNKEARLVKGKVNSDNINVRTDSTSSSDMICAVNKGELLEIISLRYDWYKVRLPQQADVYIKKNMVEIGEDNSAVVTKTNVNLRLKPDISSPILGRVTEGDKLDIRSTEGDWYKIEPLKCFGWIHKNFVDEFKEAVSADEASEQITVIGKVRPKVFTRVATHKLILDSGKVYLLHGNTKELVTFNSRNVKVTGKLINPAEYRSPPIIEIEKIEALD